MAHATIKLPLHGGHAPPYLIDKMIKLSGAIAKVIVNEYGEHEFLRRISDPLWFQAFGCVLGFDWHSSGVTTVVTGVLKQSLKVEEHGISIAGGRARNLPKLKMKSQHWLKNITIYLLIKLIVCYMQVGWLQKSIMQQYKTGIPYIIT